MASIPVAVQLWTLRYECEEDFFGTLESVAGAGYRWIEPFDFYDFAISGIARVLTDNGLGVISSHVPLERLESELDRVMDEHDELGCKHLVCPWLPEEKRVGPDAFEKIGRTLDDIAIDLKKRGFALAYHNHDFEFTRAKDPDGLQRILSSSKPERLSAQLDTYWAAHAGIDPVAYMRVLGPRLDTVHLKDGFPKEEKFSPVGSGKLDMRAIIKTGREMGVRAFIVEQDECDMPPIEAIQTSLNFLRNQGLGG